MYSFVFYFMYKYHTRFGDFNPRFTASGAVLVTICIHLFFLFCGVKYFSEEGFLNQSSFNDDYFTNKLIWMAILLPFLILSFLYYSKSRVSKIVSKYDAKRIRIFSFKNILYFLVIMFVPLILGVYFLNHSK